MAKLVVTEPESRPLERWLGTNRPSGVTSDVARTELLRAVRRQEPSLVVRARDVLASVTILHLGTATFENAGLLDPTILRTLDALHVAAALELGDELEGFVTYDNRLAEAAHANGIRVVAPA